MNLNERKCHLWSITVSWRKTYNHMSVFGLHSLWSGCQIEYSLNNSQQKLQESSIDRQGRYRFHIMYMVRWWCTGVLFVVPLDIIWLNMTQSIWVHISPIDLQDMNILEYSRLFPHLCLCIICNMFFFFFKSSLDLHFLSMKWQWTKGLLLRQKLELVCNRFCEIWSFYKIIVCGLNVDKLWRMN